MNQHDFVDQCLNRYKKMGLEPGNPDDGVWQVAHYPEPQPEGENTILLLFDDHQQQGILQSEECGRCCFFSGHTKEFLTTGPFVTGWFELWDLYDKWVFENTKKASKKAKELHPDLTSDNGKKTYELYPEEAKKKAKVMNNHPNTVEARKIVNTDRWMCTDTGFISTAGPLSRYQIARKIDTRCRVKVE